MPRRDDDFDEDDGPRRRRRMPDEFDDDSPPRKKGTSTGLILGIVAGVLLLCCGGLGTGGYFLFVRAKKAVNEVVERAHEGLESQQSQKNLHDIGIAFHNYNDSHSTLPTNSRDSKPKAGAKPTYKPLLSWRVHLLPFIDQQALWKRFKLDEPWDSQNNLPLLAEMPAIYGTPEANKRAGVGKTFYRGFTHKGAMFENSPSGGPELKLRLPASIPDGTSNTILVVEAGEAVEWTKPDDFDWSPGKPRPSLGGISPNLPFCNVLLCNAEAHKLRLDVPDQTLRWLIDRQDGNVIPNNWEFRDY